jgi:hypothetical protein
MAKTLNLNELIDLQEQLLKRIPPGTLIEDALEEWYICVRSDCKSVSNDFLNCSCDDDS